MKSFQIPPKKCQKSHEGIFTVPYLETLLIRSRKFPPNPKSSIFKKGKSKRS